MSNDHSDLATLARQFHKNHRRVFDLIATPKVTPVFKEAIARALSTNRPQAEIIPGWDFIPCGEKDDMAVVLPNRWKQAFDSVASTWPGCGKWWAGYPVVALLELRPRPGGTSGILKLNFEVGPLSDHATRTELIGTIRDAAKARGLDRIHFAHDACDKGRLYSRFLRSNSMKIAALSDAAEIERGCRQLIKDFAPEFQMVSDAIAATG